MRLLSYNKDKIKEDLTIEEVASLLSYLGGDPYIKDDQFVAKTICHNPFEEGSHKLYYYDNTKLFKCYTACGESMDIYEIVQRSKKIQEDKEWGLPQSIKYVANFFGIEPDFVFDDQMPLTLEDWKEINRLNQYQEKQQQKIETEEEVNIQLKTYDKTILKYFPKVRVMPWEKEGITYEALMNRDIVYNPSTGGIIIPHYDINSNLIGIRERTLLKENEAKGKYLPSWIDGIQYSHPLGFNLYGLDKSKENIKQLKTAVVVEGEKSVLQYESFYGAENSIICATCGSNLIGHQFKLLQSLDINEIVIGFDKDFQEVGDEEYLKVIKRLTALHYKYNCFIKISFLLDHTNKLGYKESPLDRGKEVYEYLFKNRVYYNEKQGV